MSTQILLVEDNAELAGSLADFLSEVGFEVDFAFNGQSGLELLKQNRYDVVVMDVMMPVKDGLTACAELRDQLFDQTPVLFLTARNTLEDKLKGFSAGGDDYLVKPFAPEELACRLNALLKRVNPEPAGQQKIGELVIDHQALEVYRKGVKIELHDVQFRLLTLLARSAPHPVSRSVLEDSLWPDGLPDSDPLRTHIYRLRLQLDKPFDSPLIKTVHGKGYKLVIPD
ncbi:response regulator transcription factor [Endozoicomonadaceae bacterium StTr2]